MQLISPTGLLPKEKLSFLEKFYLRICRFLFKFPHLVVFPSEFIKKTYIDFGFFRENKVAVIPNPIVLPNILVDKQDGEIITFGFLGQIEKYKGIFDLVEALKLIIGKWKLKIAGTGRDLENLKMVFGDNPQVEFLGRLNSEELSKSFWPQIDVLINPSQVAESFGLNILEAYSFGVPVLATKIGAFLELVKEDQTDWFFELQNTANLKSKIELILANPEKIKIMRQKCLEESRLYSVENYLDKILAI